MDLRLRLVAALGAMMAVLLLLACCILVLAARRDVVDEVQASSRLAEVLIRVGQLQAQDNMPTHQVLPALQAVLGDKGGEAGGGLRHLTLRIENHTTPNNEEDAGKKAASPLLSGLATWLLPASEVRGDPLRLRIGQETLVIYPDPQAELHEALADSIGIFSVLFVFCLTSLLLAWYIAHRALAPVRDVLAGLTRLAQGADQADLPPFDLQEFAAIAEGINRLATSLAQARAEQQRLTHRLLDVQESERRELARELHDEFGQMLTAMRITASYIERNVGKLPPLQIADSARDLGQEAQTMALQVRGLLSRLRPHGLEGMGLLPGLQDLLAAWQQRAPELTLEADLPDTLPTLDKQAGLALYRLLQESLTNVFRHSGATLCRVVLKMNKQGIALTVRDNGRGRVEHIAHTLGSGLLGMRERLAMVGGQLHLRNNTGQGLSVEAWLPMQGVQS